MPGTPPPPAIASEPALRLREPEPSLRTQAGIAVGCSLGAMAIRFAADPLMGSQQAFTPAFAAVAFAAWYGTWRAGLLCALVSFLWADYFFVEPRYTLDVLSAEKALQGTFYWFLVAVLLYVNHRATKSRRAARRLIERLAAADAQKSELLATLAHELRSPLSAVQTATALLDADNPSAETRRRAIATLARQTEYMNRLAEDLMDAARIQQGKISLRLEPTSVADMLSAALEAVEPALRARGQHCELSAPPDLPLLMVDPARMNQVITNLLSNASRFSREASLIRLEAAPAGPTGVRISVIDTGEGIDPSRLDSVFATFMQVHSGGQGLGLGLSLVRRLVQLHGGSVSALSRGIGDGTRFDIVLPSAGPRVQDPGTEGFDPRAVRPG
ncbi:HAMP domain-containing sensor histidine kinase [Ramlibacter sp. AN1015]|uniref:sensor histidine kinase n=1 Tax=Ramlibacter sp. AN1015 TaxID=3133428 RepID=UPI0030BE1320